MFKVQVVTLARAVDRGTALAARAAAREQHCASVRLLRRGRRRSGGQRMIMIFFGRHGHWGQWGSSHCVSHWRDVINKHTRSRKRNVYGVLCHTG